MKTLLLSLSLAVAGVSTAQAEIYRPSVVRNSAVVGAVAGALIGGHNDDRWAEGAVIGAAAGALVGVAIDQSNPRGYRHHEIAPVVEVPCAPVVTRAAPTVVYVERAVPRTRVVYVERDVRPVIVHRPVYVSRGHGHHHYGHGRDHGRRHDGHHRGHRDGHRGHRDGHRYRH